MAYGQVRGANRRRLCDNQKPHSSGLFSCRNFCCLSFGTTRRSQGHKLYSTYADRSRAWSIVFAPHLRSCRAVDGGTASKNTRRKRRKHVGTLALATAPYLEGANR